MDNYSTKTYKLHESARERNKREQRIFDMTTNGRYNEFKFKLDGINKEQRLIEKDLERIRAGVHRPPNSAIASTHKTLNPSWGRPIAERNKQEKNSPKRSPKPRRKSEEVEIDTDMHMLAEYLQKLQDADVIDINNIIADKTEQNNKIANQATTSDSEMSQSPIHQAERSGSFNNNQQSLNIKHDVDSQSVDNKSDLLYPNQRPLKPFPVKNYAKSEMEYSASEKQNNDADIKQLESSKGKDISGTKQKSSPQEDYDAARQLYTYESLGHPKTNLNSDKQWEQARRARYVRTREKLERDRELTVKEIFDQTKP